MSKRSKKKNSAKGVARTGGVAAGGGDGAYRSYGTNRTDRPQGRGTGMVWAVCAGLVVMVAIVFGRTVGFGFVNYDDQSNVYENARVTAGLSWGGVVWAFTHTQVARWAPVTTISRLVDCSLHGVNAGGHHFTNVALHAAVVVLLFLTLRAMTGALWRSAVTAGIFAVHPLNVEVVAWVSARGELVAGVFAMLALWSYARGVRCVERGSVRKGFSRAWVVAVFFGLCMMSKAAALSFPFALVALDFWPLGRFGGASNIDHLTSNIDHLTSNIEANPEAGDAMGLMGILKRMCALVVEKWVLIALAVGFGVAAMASQGSDSKEEQVALLPRVANAVWSCAVYLREMAWPSGLAALYPHREEYLGLLAVSGAAVFLVAVSVMAWRCRERMPWVLAGWAWYLLLLGPVLGIVAIGHQARADRYTYLPGIGITMAVTWSVGAMAGRWRWPRAATASLAAAVIAGLGVVAFLQVGYWQDSESLWSRALACTEGNYVAHNNMGYLLKQRGDVQGALAHYQAAVELKPGYADAQNNFGNALAQVGRVDEAMAHYRRALEAKPDNAEANNNLGIALMRTGHKEEALSYFQKAVESDADYADGQYNLGLALMQREQWDGAAEHLRRAVELRPGDAEAKAKLGMALMRAGK